MNFNHAALYPLSESQKKIWYAQQLDPSNSFFNIADIIELSSDVHVDFLRQAVGRVLDECDILKARFTSNDDTIFFHIDRQRSGELSIVEFDETLDDASVARFFDSQARIPMDLGSGPLYFFMLAKKKNGRSYFFQKYHHIVADGACFPIITRRLFEIYNCLVDGRQVRENRFGSYLQYIEREAEYQSSKRRETDQSFWSEKVSSNAGDSWSWVADNASGASLSLVSRALSAATRHMLFVAAEKLNSNPSMVFIAAAALFHGRIARTNELNANVIFSGRGAAERDTPGMMSRILPVSVDIYRDSSFAEAIEIFSMDFRASLRHSRYQGIELERALHAGKDFQSSPTINFMTLDYGDAPFVSARCPAVGPIRGFTINVYDRVNLEEMTVEFAADSRFGDQSFLRKLLARFETFLREVLTHPDQAIGSIELLAEDERRQIVEDWNATSHAIPDAVLPELFEAQ
ncbi:hypothetical protein HFN86_35770, partial [Rhizobium laguerreae]|uniref:condensation domain-containing protein n=1 Tax=Rhizobium laguerreae TaxID=1076926 RepID=UPI001C906718